MYHLYLFPLAPPAWCSFCWAQPTLLPILLNFLFNIQCFPFYHLCTVWVSNCYSYSASLTTQLYSWGWELTISSLCPLCLVLCLAHKTVTRWTDDRWMNRQHTNKWIAEVGSKGGRGRRHDNSRRIQRTRQGINEPEEAGHSLWESGKREEATHFSGVRGRNMKSEWVMSEENIEEKRLCEGKTAAKILRVLDIRYTIWNNLMPREFLSYRKKGDPFYWKAELTENLPFP